MQLLDGINVDQGRLADFHFDPGRVMTINQAPCAHVTLKILNGILQKAGKDYRVAWQSIRNGAHYMTAAIPAKSIDEHVEMPTGYRGHVGERYHDAVWPIPLRTCYSDPQGCRHTRCVVLIAHHLDWQITDRLQHVVMSVAGDDVSAGTLAG
jgi:hypothetical protein